MSSNSFWSSISYTFVCKSNFVLTYFSKNQRNTFYKQRWKKCYLKRNWKSLCFKFYLSGYLLNIVDNHQTYIVWFIRYCELGQWSLWFFSLSLKTLYPKWIIWIFYNLHCILTEDVKKIRKLPRSDSWKCQNLTDTIKRFWDKTYIVLHLFKRVGTIRSLE